MSTLTRRERRRTQRDKRRKPPSVAGRKRPAHRASLVLIGAALVIVVVALFAGGRALGVFGPASAPTTSLSATKYDVAGETIGTHEADEGNPHIPVGQKATYKTDPPTSGAHWNQAPVAPVPWGIKDATAPNEAILHNLEHGGVVVFYKDLSADDLAKLRDLVRTISQGGYPKIVLEPYPLTDSHIALSAWRWSLKLPGYDDVQIVKFVKAHYEGPDAPEPQTR